MTLDTFLWIAAVGIPAIFTSFAWLTLRIEMAARDRKDTDAKLTRLLLMHERPDEYGFGTKATNKIIEDNTRAVQALTHYIQWLAQHTTGQTPPPPVE